MFSLGLSSVLGNRDSSSKKRHSGKPDEWYIPYNGPYERPRRDATPWTQKPRDSWGDPIPFDTVDESLELGGGEGVGSKELGRAQDSSYRFAGDAGMKYGVHGVFDDGWKGIAVKGCSGYGGVSDDRARGRRASRGNESQPTALEPVNAGKKKLSPPPRRRSAVSSVVPSGVPDYVSLDTTSGGVGESPVPYARGPKDTHRVSLASIFSFGARMKTGSPTRSLDGRERRDSADPSLKWSRKRERVDTAVDYRDGAGSFGDNVHHQPHSVANASAKMSNRKKHAPELVDKHNSLGTEDDAVYHNYYASFFSTLVDGIHTDGQSHAVSKNTKPRQQQPLPTTEDSSNVDPHPPRASPRQKSISTTGAHPYAPYSHHNHAGQGQNRDAPVIHHQPRQTQPAYRRHPYGQSSVSTGASSSSHQSQLPTSRSMPSYGHGESQESSTKGHLKVAFPTGGAVASELGSSGVGTTAVGLGAGKTIKNSTSTPNLHHNNSVAGASNLQRGAPARPLPIPPQKQPPPVIKDRWLSAETWCDALLFPRPRLKVKRDHDPDQPSSEKSPIASQKSSGRLVSPPGSPPGTWTTGGGGGAGARTRRDFPNDEGQTSDVFRREPGFTSRVLAHSWSSVDLRPTQGYPSVMPPATASASASVGHQGTREPTVIPNTSPEDWALPTVVPSVADVLAERQHLEEERLAWQALAVNSVGNKRSRSLSQTRTKSLTKRGRASMRKKPNEDVNAAGNDQDTRQTSFEYLAAQACLGNQNVALTPNASFKPDFVGNVTSVPGISTGGSGGDPSRGSHSHSNSHATSAVPTTSSKPPHSKNGSWNHTTAGRMGKLCGNPGLDVDLHMDDGDDVQRRNNNSNNNTAGNAELASEVIQQRRATPDLEDALKRQDTRVIRLADPAHIPLDKGMPVSQSLSSNQVPPIHQSIFSSSALSASATSLISESKVGIALGVPPEEAEAIAAGIPYLPSHPYAQGGLSFSNVPPTSRRGAETEGNAQQSGTSRIKKHIVHPYAAGIAAAATTTTDESKADNPRIVDGYAKSSPIAQSRSEDGSLDSSSKLPPGNLQGDLQYSPFASESGRVGQRRRQGNRNGDDAGDNRIKSIHDTAGVSAALLTTKVDRQGSVSSLLSSGSSTSQLRMLGSPNDLDDFQDLFYQPSPEDSQPSSPPDLAAIPSNAADASWDLAVRNRRTGGGLTSLTRQLSEEYDAIAGNASAATSGLYYSYYHSSHRHSRSLSALPQLSSSLGLSSTTEEEGGHHLHFVLEEARRGESPAVVLDVNGELRAFQFPRSLPEDVEESSRASSLMDHPEEEDDPTAMLRLGMVESLATPRAIDPEHGRLSFNGETIFAGDGQEENRSNEVSNNTMPLLRPGTTDIWMESRNGSGETLNPSNSGLLNLSPPYQRHSQIIRNSSMTTSDVSRMSALSDFPVPPNTMHSELDPRMSLLLPTPLLTSTLDGDVYAKRVGISGTAAIPLRGDSPVPELRLKSASSRSLPEGGQVEFGSDQSADELALSLSSPYP